VAGISGSGKTLSIKLLMQRAFSPERTHGRKQRALVYDVKPEFYPFLLSLDIAPEDVFILNPFDPRSHSWAIAKDITGPNQAQQFAHMMFPITDTKDKYFDASAAELLRGVLLSFQRAWPIKSRAWNLRDVLLAFHSSSDLLAILSWLPADNRKRIEDFNEADRSVRDVLRTAGINIAEFEIVAALWEHAHEPISMKHWMENGGVLLLGDSVETPRALASINRVLLQRLSQVLLTQPEHPDTDTWLFLDELPRLAEGGTIEGLRDIIREGRSKNVGVVLGFQDIASLRTALGGRDPAAALLASIHSSAVFACNHDTAKWAEELFGSNEDYVEETSKSTSWSWTQSSTDQTTTSKRLMTRPVFMAGEFQALMPPDPKLGTPLSGFYKAYGRAGPFKEVLPLDEILATFPKASKEPAFLERPGEDDQILRPWFEPERQALGLPQRRPRPSADSPEPEEELDFQ
jgi:type IV secretory pathway TraG/TraD family ATPase VirD4